MNINAAFPSKFLKAPDLGGVAVVVTIADVKIEQVGQTKDTKPVLYFHGKVKGLILNKTNAARIAQLAGSGETEDWTGVQVQLYVSETEYQGEPIECIRVRAVPSTRRGAVPEPAPRPVAVLRAAREADAVPDEMAAPDPPHAVTDDDIPF